MRLAWALELAGQALTGFALVMGVVVAVQLADMPMTVANAMSIAIGATGFALMFFALADQVRRSRRRPVVASPAAPADEDNAEVTIASSETDALLSAQAGAAASSVHQK